MTTIETKIKLIEWFEKTPTFSIKDIKQIFLISDDADKDEVVLETALEDLIKDGFVKKITKNKNIHWIWLKPLSSVWQQVNIDSRTAKSVTDIVNAYLEAAEETEFEDPTKITERAILILCDLYHNLMIEHMSLVDGNNNEEDGDDKDDKDDNEEEEQ